MSDVRDAGDAWVTAADGGRYWGRFGAAGLLAFDQARESILLQHRVTWSHHGDTWGIPGGARHQGESAPAAALRESHEEAGVPASAVRPRYAHVFDRGGWTYTTVIAEVTTPFEPEIGDPESHALAWVPLSEVESYTLHPGFASNWPAIRPLLKATPTLIIDAANVIGSVPDGWWKDRRGAAERLRDRIERLAALGHGVRAGFMSLSESQAPGVSRVHPDWRLVVEGRARGIDSSPHVDVIDAEAVGDDAIVAEVERARAAGALSTVITGDAELKVRVRASGAASTRGPRKLLDLLRTADG